MSNALRSDLLRYGAAVVGVALATAVRLALDPVLGDLFPFATLFLAVLFAAGHGGLGPALLATALGAVASARFLLPPRGSFAMRGVENVAGMALFLAVGLGVAVLGGAMRGARRRAEANEAEALRQGERLRITLASIGDAVVVTDAGGRVTSLNRVAEALTGWTEGEAAGRPLGDVFRVVDEATRAAPGSPAPPRAADGGSGVAPPGRAVLIARDGTERPVEDSVSPVRDNAGAVVGAVLVFRDVRERRRADDARRRLAALVESSDDAIVGKDLDGVITSWNAGAERLYGYTAAEAVGRPFSILVPPNRAGEVDDSLRRIRQGVRVDHFETVRGRKGGGTVEVSVSYSPVKDEAGRLVGAAVIARDVSAAKRAARRRDARLTLARTLARAGDLAGAAPGVLQALCEGLGWDFGALWVVDRPAGSLRFLDAWHPPLLKFGAFEAATRGMSPAPAGSLLGRVQAGGVPVWVPDVTSDDRFDPRRRDAAAGDGLRGAFACPVSLGAESLGVIELFSREVREPDPDVLEMLATAGGQLGLFLERTRAEGSLRVAEARFAAVVDHSPSYVFAKDARGRYVLANPGLARFLGTSVSAIVGRTDADFFPPEAAAKFARDDAEVLATGRPATFEETVPRGDTEVTTLTVKFPLNDHEGKPFAVCGIATDVTASKRAEQALRVSEERFRMMAESIPQLAWIARPDGHIEWYNRRWHEYTGTTPAQMEGWGWQSVHDPDVLPAVMERWRASIASGEPFDMVFPLRGADGRFRPFLTRVMPVRGDDGRVAHWFGTNTDITDRQRFEEELRAARDEAEGANQAKTQFLAVLSHELRTPLNPILLATSAILERPYDPAEVRPTLEMIRRNVNLQARLIDDLLDVMRIVRGKMPLRWEVVDGHALVAQAVAICRDEVSAKGLRLVVDTAAPRHTLNADPARMQQAFWNLLKNAVKFTPAGGSVSVRTRNEEDASGAGTRLLIEVSDTGIGIEPGALPRIFEPFQQGETTITRKFGGLGLGLAICRGIVEAHGGTLTGRSDGKDRGTTFVVAVPALTGPAPVDGDGDGDGRGEPAAVAPAAAADPSSLVILVVEDEPTTMRLMARLLRGLGHGVATAATVAAALETLEAKRFDMIISDIGLPDGSGLDLIRRTVALRGPIPAIALTGYGMEEDVRRSREAGFTAHLTKPIDFTKLEAMIRRVAPTLS